MTTYHEHTALPSRSNFNPLPRERMINPRPLKTSGVSKTQRSEELPRGQFSGRDALHDVDPRFGRKALQFERGQVLSDYQRSKSEELSGGGFGEMLPRYDALPADKLPDTLPSGTVPKARYGRSKPLPERPRRLQGRKEEPVSSASLEPQAPPDPLHPREESDKGPTAMTWPEFIEKEEMKPTTWKHEEANPSEEPAAPTMSKFGRPTPVKEGGYREQRPVVSESPEELNALTIPPPPPPPMAGVSQPMNPEPSLPESHPKPSQRSRKDSRAESARGTLEKVEENIKAMVMDVKAGVKELFGKDVTKDKELAEHYREEGERKQQEHRRKKEFYDAKSHIEEVHGH